MLCCGDAREMLTNPLPELFPDSIVAPAPMPGQEAITLIATLGRDDAGRDDAENYYPLRDGPAEATRLPYIHSMVRRPNGDVLWTGFTSRCIGMLSADLKHVSLVAGDGTEGHRDGAAAQASFCYPGALAQLPDGRVLVAENTYIGDACRIRVLSADLQQVETVAGPGGIGLLDGPAMLAQFDHPNGFAVLHDGRVLVADVGNSCIRVLSADLQQVSTLAGTFSFSGNPNRACGITLLRDGRVLLGVSDRILVMSADLQHVCTVAGEDQPDEHDGMRHRDGAARQALFNSPEGFAVLPDGGVLVTDHAMDGIRVLSADLQQVTTLAGASSFLGSWGYDGMSALPLLGGMDARCLALPDGRVLVTNPSTKPERSYDTYVIYVLCELGNFNWIRRRTLLMSLLAAQQRAGDVKRTSTVTTATGDDEVLRRMAVLPEALWEGIFRFM